MDLDVVFNSKLNVVSVKATGELNNTTGASIAEKTLETAAKHKCNKVFCDYSNVKVTASFLEIYENPHIINRWEIPHHFKIAVLYSEDEKSFKFWETRMYNTGFVARIFQNEDEALKWLTNDTSY